MTSISHLQTWELFWVNRILQGPSFVYFTVHPSYIKENGKYWAGQSNKTSEMNLRIFLIVLSVAESFSLTGMMKLRRFRLKRAFKNVEFIKNKRTIVTKMSSNNLFKIKNISFAVRSSCSNCNSRGSRGSRFSLWSKRFQ